METVGAIQRLHRWPRTRGRGSDHEGCLARPVRGPRSVRPVAGATLHRLEISGTACVLPQGKDRASIRGNRLDSEAAPTGAEIPTEAIQVAVVIPPRADRVETDVRFPSSC